jgi:tRNA nucleotidyltransferase (CCA-adding enzyme)
MHKAGLMNQKKDLSVKLAFLFEPIADQRGNEKVIDAIKRLRYDAKTIKEVKKMLFYKNRTIVPGKKQIKLWMNRMGDVLFEKLLSLKGFDEDMQKQETIVKDILSKNECYSLQTLDIKGKDLIAYGAAEGEALGRILQALLFDVILNKVPNQKKKLLERAKHYMDDQ